MKSNETLEKKINEAALRVSPAVSVSVPQKWMAPLAEENKCKRERGRRGATVPEHEEVLFFFSFFTSFFFFYDEERGQWSEPRSTISADHW